MYVRPEPPTIRRLDGQPFAGAPYDEGAPYKASESPATKLPDTGPYARAVIDAPHATTTSEPAGQVKPSPAPQTFPHLPSITPSTTPLEGPLCGLTSNGASWRLANTAGCWLAA